MVIRQKDTRALALMGGIVFGTGFAGGLLTRHALQKKMTLHGDKILENVKKQFLKEGTIEGSWIELTQVPLRKFALKTDVYYGGISRMEEDKLMQYEFIADAHTGSILDIYRV